MNILTHFNPRSPHGERPQHLTYDFDAGTFQSTLPARGATQQRIAYFTALLISIHAPRTGSDIFCKSTPDSFAIFQSTLPARGATQADSQQGTELLFQSTLPARGATGKLFDFIL